MYSQETIQQFIDKRASGTPLHLIAEEIGVSKTTLVAWKQKYALEILSAQQDAALEHQTNALNLLATRQTYLDDSFNRLVPLIDNFDPDEVSIFQAFRLYFLIQRESLKLQQLRFKLELETSKLHQPIPEAKLPRSNFGQIFDHTESPTDPIPPSTDESSKPAKSSSLPTSSRKRSNFGQKTKRPDFLRDNFLQILNNPPTPQFLQPPSTPTELITSAPREIRLLPAKLPKDTLDIANSILKGNLPEPKPCTPIEALLKPLDKSFLEKPPET